jgi:hypothetical protein
MFASQDRHRYFAGCICSAIALTMATAATARAASPWQIIKVDGHDYVSVENTAKFYGFPEPAPKIDNSERVRESKIEKVKIDNGKDELEFTLARREVMINNVRNWLSFPVIAKDGKLLVSRMDLAKRLEPQLRSHMIPNIGKVKTVVLDPGHGGYDKGACSVTVARRITHSMSRVSSDHCCKRKVCACCSHARRLLCSARSARAHRQCRAGCDFRQHPFQRDRSGSGRDWVGDFLAYAIGRAFNA